MRPAVDDAVLKVLAFMQASVPADKLVFVAQAVAAIGPLVWGPCDATPFKAMWLEPERLPGSDD